MKNGGVCVIKVPNYASWNRIVRGKKWCGFRYPEHVNYFTPDSLGKMADASGLRAVQTFMDVLPISDNMWAVLIKK